MLRILKGKMNSYIRKISATNLFVLPILNIGREKLLKVGFVEAFIKDELRELEYENAVYLLFKPENWDEFNLFLEEQREVRMPLVDEYHHGEWAVVIYQYPKQWQRDVDIIMTGKFSQVSRRYKDLIPFYYKVNRNGIIEEEIMNQHLIYNKSQKVKDYWKKELDLDFEEQDEVWLYYQEREILNKASLKRLTEINKI